MIVNDKTVDENTDCFGKISEAANQGHHITDYMGFMIAEKNVWCMNGLTDKAQRNELAQSLSTRHQEWRIENLKIYKTDCRTYLKERLVWE